MSNWWKWAWNPAVHSERVWKGDWGRTYFVQIVEDSARMHLNAINVDYFHHYHHNHQQQHRTCRLEEHVPKKTYGVLTFSSSTHLVHCLIWPRHNMANKQSKNNSSYPFLTTKPIHLLWSYMFSIFVYVCVCVCIVDSINSLINKTTTHIFH